MHRAVLACLGLLFLVSSATAETRPPNVVYMMADELGYYEVSYMGNPNIRTPNLDRMAAAGIRFNNLFAGSSVCAPTRCSFLTGKHSGHTSVRVNGGGTPLRAEEETIASMLKRKGYATGGFGKWGCGGRDSTGVPERHGFDVFLGYYDQVHAHSFYPPYILRNSEEVPLAGNRGLSDGETYSHYVIFEGAVDFIRQHKDKPFFCYLPVTPPHGAFDIPDSDPAWAMYQDKPWPEPARRYAAMVTMIDRQLGDLLELLKELGLAEQTLVMFSGDNGGADYFASPEYPRGIHGANKHPQTGVEYRGRKGNLYEGGLRIPFVAYWPGKIAPGQVSDHLCYFPDMLPTIAEVTGSTPPADIDGISILPTLVGQQAAGHPQKQHEYLYWEIGSWTAIRQGDWRAVQPKTGGDWELYDLSTDPSESNDVSAQHPHVLAKLKALAAAAHQPAVEGTFSTTERHERDRRAKYGKHDDTSIEATPSGVRKKEQTNQAAHRWPTEGVLASKNWKIARVSSENVGNAKFAANAIDGNPLTVWHTRFSGSEPEKHPHELVIDLGASHRVRALRYLARQDNGWNGTIRDIEVAVSDDPDAFGEPVAKTAFTKTREPQEIAFEPTTGRYVRIRALSEVNAGPWASAAELGLVGE
jgi:arylsulfatase A-like enzyme